MYADSLAEANCVLYRQDSLWTDTLSWAGALIDGKFPVFGFIESLRKKGKADSVYVSGEVNCGSPLDWLDTVQKARPVVTISYIDGMSFYENGNRYILEKTDMTRHSLVFPYRQLSLDRDTKLSDCAKLFPQAWCNAMRSSQSSDKNEFVLRVSYTNMDDCWVLHFRNGKLVSVDVWWLLC